MIAEQAVLCSVLYTLIKASKNFLKHLNLECDFNFHSIEKVEIWYLVLLSLKSNKAELVNCVKWTHLFTCYYRNCITNEFAVKFYHCLCCLDILLIAA